MRAATGANRNGFVVREEQDAAGAGGGGQGEDPGIAFLTDQLSEPGGLGGEIGGKTSCYLGLGRAPGPFIYLGRCVEGVERGADGDTDTPGELARANVFTLPANRIEHAPGGAGPCREQPVGIGIAYAGINNCPRPVPQEIGTGETP